MWACVLVMTAWTAAPLEGLALPVESLTVACDSTSPAVEEAVRHFESRVAALGGSVGKGDRKLRIGCAPSEILAPERLRQHVDGLKGFQSREGYFLAWDGSTSHAAGLGELGTVYAVSDLELRLRVHEGHVYLHFPEWREGEPGLLFEKPALEVRGEYLNIGYDIPQITPHQWSTKRWHAYIDKLVLSRLNRLYFYVWNDTYTMYPGSDLSKRPMNRRIHEGLRDAIDYAHRRGLEVTYMMCPSFLPKDLWDAHPEYHADIEYVRHGFAATCSSAPGAWDLMRDVGRSEMQWFQAADAIQIWFYDPGGCWCEKYGCKANQADILARQVREFGGLFRELNPAARVEYNLWPIWLWEDQLGIQYRRDLDERIRRDFGTSIMAVGAPDSEATLPSVERDLGFRTSVFLFGTNPETAYVFATPHLGWVQEAARRIAAEGYGGAFGHRLEAWTRFPGTYFMAQFLWDPEADPEAVVRRFADWQTGEIDRGAKLAEALLLLDRFTHEGADPETGARMEALAREACEGLTGPRAEEVSSLLATTTALNAIARSLAAESEEVLAPYVAEFDAALKRSEDFSGWEKDSRRVFDSYRKFLRGGWAKEHF